MDAYPGLTASLLSKHALRDTRYLAEAGLREERQVLVVGEGEQLAFEALGLLGDRGRGAWRRAIMLGSMSMPTTSTPVAWFRDPDGNLLSLSQFAASD